MEWKRIEDELPLIWESFLLEWDSGWQKAIRYKTTVKLFWHKEEYTLNIDEILDRKWLRIPKVK